MSVSGISSSGYVAPAALTQGVQSSQVSGASDPDGDGDSGGGHRAHKSRGAGGQMQNALMQALQSLGLSAPQSTTGTTATASSSQTSSGADSDGDTDGSTSASSSVKKDMRQFMHALFQAVKSESATSTSSSTGTGSTSTDPKANFAAGLSALISQVSNGTAPADLQSAFDKVAADLKPTATTSASASGSSSSSSSNSGTSASTPQATLQALLTQLQQNLGYGATSSTAAIGNFLSTQA